MAAKGDLPVARLLPSGVAFAADYRIGRQNATIGGQRRAMANQNEIVAIMVRLLVDGQQSLFIMLGDDGSISRMGTGRVDKRQDELFVGKTDAAMFQGLRQQIGPELLDWFGKQLEDTQARGKICELTVALKYADGRESATAWRYGTESPGPPPEAVQFVIAAVNTTNPWFEEFRSMSRSSRA